MDEYINAKLLGLYREIAKEKNIYFHSDGVQTVGKIPVDVKSLSVDALSIS